MSKKTAKKKIHKKKSIDPFTSASDIERSLVDKKMGKRSPQEKNRFDRQQQKEIVRQLTAELIELSEKDMLKELSDKLLEEHPEENPNFRKNDIIYTIKPVNYED